MFGNVLRNLYVGIRYNETLASWRSAQSREEARNIQWCQNNPTVRTNIILSPALQIYKKQATWMSFPEYTEYERSTVCLKKV